MSYILVKTLEDGVYLNSTVPKGWVLENEGQNILYWPNTKNVEKLQKNPHTAPDLRTWTQTPCTIITRNLKSFREGVALEKKMSGFSDTDEDENERTGRLKRKINPSTNLSKKISRSQNCISITHDPCQSAIICHMMNDEESSEINKSNTYRESNMFESSNVDTVGPNDLNDLISRIETNQAKLQNEIEMLKINQNQILNTVTNLMAENAELIRLLSICNASNTKVQSEEEVFSFEPIETVEELIVYEKKLKNKSYMEKLTEHLTKFGGISGKKNGWDVSYKTIDHYITRELMQLCQWTNYAGKGRTALIDFRNILKCFYNAILKSDSRYTFAENEQFFMAVCRNSRRRLDEKLLKIGK